MVLATLTDRTHGWGSPSPFVTAVLVLGILVACSTRQVPPRTAEPVGLPADTLVSESPPITRFQEDTARYFIEAVIVTQELSPGSSHDSSSFHEEIDAQLLVRPDSTIELILKADRGFRNPHDSAAKPATLAGPRTITPPVVHFRLGQQQPVELSRATSMACPSFPTLLTPLLGRLMVLALSPSHHLQPDTLTYTACLADVAISSRYILQPRPEDRRLEIIGELHGDSTRFLPMRLDGSVHGSLMLGREFTPILPRKLALQLSANLSFSSSVRKQQLRQETSVTIRREVQ